jgi:hypothetical protein
MQNEARPRSMTYLRETRQILTRWSHWLSRQAAPPLRAMGLSPSATRDGANLWDEAPTGHVDAAAYERQLLGHLLDASKTMLP